MKHEWNNPPPSLPTKEEAEGDDIEFCHIWYAIYEIQQVISRMMDEMVDEAVEVVGECYDI